VFAPQNLPELTPHRLAVAVAALVAAVVAIRLWRTIRTTPPTGRSERPPAAVVVAAISAVACTAYSADTSWRFAEHSLGMVSAGERAAMFAAAELALFAVALMARQNLRTQGAPGVPGVLVWFITGVQVIPAYSESGIVGGTVRAVVGPILAALLWHLAMGIELRHGKPGTNSGSLPAMLTRELRERLMSRLGLAVRDRSAEQIARDRWTVKAVGLAARLASLDESARKGWRGRRLSRRLSVAVGRAQVGASTEQRARLLELLAARRHASALATVELASPWRDVGASPGNLPSGTRKAASALPAATTSQVPAPASPPRQPSAKPLPPAAPPVATPATEQAANPASPASASDASTGRDLDEVAAAYRALRISLNTRRPSSAKLGEALGVSRSRGQQLRDQLETHPDYAAEFAPALKSA
jgi:hypothetical protein